MIGILDRRLIRYPGNKESEVEDRWSRGELCGDSLGRRVKEDLEVWLIVILLLEW